MSRYGIRRFSNGLTMELPLGWEGGGGRGPAKDPVDVHWLEYEKGGGMVVVSKEVLDSPAVWYARKASWRSRAAALDSRAASPSFRMASSSACWRCPTPMLSLIQSMTGLPRWGVESVVRDLTS